MKEEKSDLDKAMSLIKEKRILRIIDENDILEDHFKIQGKHRDYIVSLPNFCTCEHFVFRCLKNPGGICYHIRAAQMAGDVDKISTEEVTSLLYQS